MENETKVTEETKTEVPKEEPKKADDSAEVKKLKAAIDRLTAENAEKKRELQARMSEQEKAEADRLEKEKALTEELESYRKKEVLATSKAGFLTCGMNESLAEKASEMWVGNDLKGFVSAFQDFLKEHDKETNASYLKSTPKPPIGGVPTGVTSKEFAKMTYVERLKLKEDNSELYNSLVNK